MLSEPMTLYKLMILYMLRQVNFPLTEDRLSEFFLSREYTTYFTLKQALAELIDAELIRCHQVANTTRYTITPEGADTYQFFGQKIQINRIAHDCVTLLQSFSNFDRHLLFGKLAYYLQHFSGQLRVEG